MWVDVRGLGDYCGPRRAANNGLREIVRRSRAQRLIDVGEMLAIQLVELAVVSGMMLGPIPPIPVAALGDEKLFIGQGALRFRST